MVSISPMAQLLSSRERERNSDSSLIFQSDCFLFFFFLFVRSLGSHILLNPPSCHALLLIEEAERNLLVATRPVARSVGPRRQAPRRAPTPIAPTVSSVTYDDVIVSFVFMYLTFTPKTAAPLIFSCPTFSFLLFILFNLKEGGGGEEKQQVPTPGETLLLVRVPLSDGA